MMDRSPGKADGRGGLQDLAKERKERKERRREESYTRRGEMAIDLQTR
jgi:hypothetical protein